jgi:L-ascorbate metabolism protein UlaG (beta-lactamase superfamily)
MIIKFLGHSCFYIKSDSGASILTDPYKPGAYGGALTFGPITDAADLVVLSHEHEDHADIGGLPGQPLMIRASSVAHGVEFDVVPSYHDNVQGKERGENRITCFPVDDVRVCHVGDLGHVLTPEQVEAIGSVDVLLLPIGGTFTIGPDEATEVMNQLNPRIVIPMHYRSTKCGFPILPLDPFLEDKPHIRKSPSSEVVLRKEDLPKDTTVLCLPPAN